MPTMEKITILLELSERESGYLLASVVEFHHALRKASDSTPQPPDIFEKIQLVKNLWLEIEKQTGIS